MHVLSVWVVHSEVLYMHAHVNLLNKAKTTTEAQAGVSPYLIDIAHKILVAEYGWGAATREEVSSWLAEHKKAFERGYGQSLRMYDDDKINVRAGIDAILNEEEGAVTDAEIAMMESGPKEWFGKEDIVQALSSALHNEDEAYVIRFFEGTPGYAYAYNKNGYDSWKVYADGTVEWEFDGTYQGNKKISSLTRLPRAMKELCNFRDEDHEVPQSAAWTPEIKKIKDLKKGEWFTLKPIEYPKESQVWSLEGYDRSTRKYWAVRWSDIGDSREFKGDKEVYTGFTF